jgi:hypothetical protein
MLFVCFTLCKFRCAHKIQKQREYCGHKCVTDFSFFCGQGLSYATQAKGAARELFLELKLTLFCGYASTHMRAPKLQSPAFPHKILCIKDGVLIVRFVKLLFDSGPPGNFTFTDRDQRCARKYDFHLQNGLRHNRDMT